LFGIGRLKFWEKLRIEKAELIVNQQLAIVHSIAELRTTLLKPRVIWSMLPAGEATEAVLQEVSTFAEGGDISLMGKCQLQRYRSKS